MNQLCFILAFLVLSCGGATAWVEGVDAAAANDALAGEIENSSRYVVSVQRVTVGDARIDDTLEITLNSFGKPIAAFELKFGMESRFLDIDTVLPGEFYDSCRWQFFNSRSINTEKKEGCPPVLWQVVALAEVAPGGAGPLCFGLEGPASLVKLVVSSEHVAQVPDTVVPIFFFWEDCSDNTIANLSGDTLLLAERVFDYRGDEFLPESDLFPNRTGATKRCINPSARNQPRRLIEFHNGGVEFKLDLGGDITDSTSVTPEKQ